MTIQDKIKVLAEMDGWIFPEYKSQAIPDYLISRDAIIPLIVKWCGKSNERWHAFQMACAEVSQDWTMAYSAVQALMEMPPNQLADALIKAADKWKD